MLAEADLDDLRRAKRLLEHPSWTIRLSNWVGRPFEWGLAKLPFVGRIATSATKAALDAALVAAMGTLKDAAPATPSDRLHRFGAGVSGALGGAAGFAGLPFELPVSTVLMLRSIADNARAQGEDLSDPASRLECMLVFGLGGSSRGDDASETGYFAVRAALARAVSEAAAFVAEKGAARAVADRAAPVLIRFLAPIAQRFNVAVSEKLVAQAAPILGGIGGAAINLAFMSHFQDVAWGHFTVRRLERLHGADVVRAAYASLS